LNVRDFGSGFDDINEVHSVKVDSGLFRKSKLFGLMDYYKSMYVLGKDRMMYDHDHGISPEVLLSDKVLSGRLDIVGTSVGSNGKEYVAIVKHKKLPFYGVQFHPEKSQFEKKFSANDVINRNKETIDVSSDFIKSWVEENRTSRDYEIDPAGLSAKAQAYLAWNFLSLQYSSTTFETVFWFTDMSQCGQDCAAQISADAYNDSIYDLYKIMRSANKNSHQKIVNSNSQIE
jgi:hypothetical protein